MGEFTPEQQQAFCQFVTGAPRLPASDLASLNPKLTIMRKYANLNSGIGFPGAFELISQGKSNGLKVIVVSSTDRIKVYENLAALGLRITVCIAVMTTLSKDTLKKVEPSLSRKEISDISLEDILNGGSGSHSM
ncbi:hypothetical protein CQW23_14549 [Capsicum baccatum]|uniref:HECT domain-containing protein n=1 Tax=Capsicum baccatum TaxID=33114 RepID=A0A2G2WJI1_CAPBA|nr:hypothetical protein CQW23_14549 [Capsicum baccatum]